jgi:cell division protein FtsQ
MDADAYPREVLADEEPRYLRRQKPLEIKRRKFGRKAWKTYLRVTAWAVAGIAGLWMAYLVWQFLFASRELALIHPEQVEIAGNHNVPRARVLELFTPDRGRSVLRIPLDERRRQLEAIPWVEQATVRRALPNKIEVDIVERKPIAFLRQASELALVDVHGVILERPLKGDFHFPVVTGIRGDLAPEDRERRMQLYAGFAEQVQAARAGGLEQVNEVDLSDINDLRATLTDLPGGKASVSSGGRADAPVLVHFGDGDFQGKYRTLLENIAQWRAAVGRVESVDLRFSREAVINPDTSAMALKQMPTHPAIGAAVKHSR